MGQALAEVETIIGRHDRESDKLIPILQEIQRVLGYLPEEAMQKVADTLGVALSEVYGVASFYSLFATAQKGKHVIRVCTSTPCHVQDADRILAALKNELGVNQGQTTADGVFTLECTSCLGTCDQGPVMMVDDRVHGKLTPAKVKEIIENYRQSANAAGR